MSRVIQFCDQRAVNPSLFSYPSCKLYPTECKVHNLVVEDYIAVAIAKNAACGIHPTDKKRFPLIFPDRASVIRIDKDKIYSE